MSDAWIGLVVMTLAVLQPPGEKKSGLDELYEQLPTRSLLRGPDGAAFLVRRGEAAFPDLIQILGDPHAETGIVEQTFCVLAQIKADRSRFLEPTLARLGDKQYHIRREAVLFLAHIGSERDTAPVAVLLLDWEATVRFAAAKTLAAIGGKRDLIVFDLVIRDADRHLDRDGKPILNKSYVEHYTQCRAKLEQRLRDAEKKTTDEPKAPAAKK